MTLVLAYANTDFVTVAVDRRVTVGKSVYDDKRTKTLAWGNELIVAFTGLAEIGADRQHTMRWLSETIARHGVFDTELIVPELSAAVDAAPFQPEDKRLALVAVGYIGGRIVYMLISNMHSDSGDLLDSPRCDYWVCVDQPEVRSTVRTVGQQMPSKAGQEMLERLRSTHGERLPSQKTVRDILAGAIQASAGSLVGDTALITTIERGKGGTFDVVTPKAKPGYRVDVASPYFVTPGTVMVMPSQPLRLSRQGHG